MPNNRGIKLGMSFVPLEYRHAFEGVSKAHLADVVWSLAGRCVETSADVLEDVFAQACQESERVSLDRRDVSLSKVADRFHARIDRAERSMVGPE
jgi:hypothetical protein